MIVRCVDFETTGLEPPDAAVCEIGWTDVYQLPPDAHGVQAWGVSPPKSVLVNPGHRIPPAMSALHHIVDADVRLALFFDDAMTPLLHDEHDELTVAFCAHNAKFERQFFANKLPWICSYKVAIHLAPDAPAHNLQTLRYWLNLAVNKDMAAPPHRAGPDSYVGAHLLARMLPKLTVDQMIEISSRPAILPKFHFGKYNDCPLANVPSDYLDWIVRQKDMDEDVVFTARHHLKIRGVL